MGFRYRSGLWIGIVAMVFAAMPFCASAQSEALEVFGKNRIQTRKFQWKYFDTKHFRIYHYDKAGLQLARYVAEEAERDIKVVEQKLGGQFPKRFNIILYNSYDEYQQTNVGLKDEAQQANGVTPTGTIDLVGDKLVVYFTGEHKDLKRQLRAGMSKVVMQRLIFGESFKQMVKNSVFLNLPAWVTEGYISYLVDGWDAQSNSKWKELMDARPGDGFYELSEDYPELAGKAFWKFVSDEYGDNTVKDLLHTMQQKSSLNQGMRQQQTLGMKVRQAYKACMDFYKKSYAEDLAKRDLPDSTKGILNLKIPLDKTVLQSVRVSPRGNDVAYVTWLDGEFFVHLQKTKDEQSSAIILQGGRKDFTDRPDPDYPLLCWSNDGLKLAILYKTEGKLHLRIYYSLRAKIDDHIIPKNRFDRVLGMSFLEDDNQMVFSAIKKSQTDLYEFTINRSKIKNITNDLWDDTQPWFVSGGTKRGILFLSNRPKPNLNVPLQVNELPTGPMNVFFYDTKTQRPELLQCSHVTSGTVTQPIQYGSENFAFLYDSNGIQNKYVVVFGRDKKNKDSAYAVAITNYPQNIIVHQYNPASNNVADVIQEGDAYKVYFHGLQIPGANVKSKEPEPTNLSKIKAEATTAPKEPEEVRVYKGRPQKIESAGSSSSTATPLIKSGNAFQSEFAATDTTPAVVPNVRIGDQKTAFKEIKKEEGGKQEDETDSSFLKEINDSAYLKMKPVRYRASFKPDGFTVKLDNSILFNQYQSLQNNGGSFTNPSLSGLVIATMNDVMENHRFTGGFQLPVNFSGSAYFLQYDNFTRRMDWGLIYLRTSNTYDYLVNYTDNANHVVLQEVQPGKAVTNLLQANFCYPLDRVRSIRFHTGFRYDQLHLAPVDSITLVSDLPSSQKSQYWTLNRLEYVFDNTTSPFINIRNGFRYKFYLESIYGLNNGNLNCYNFGTDFRYYQKIYKNFIWASRIAYAHSDGNAEVLYSLGGVDNWLLAQQNNSLQPTGGPYAFQALATELRGYRQNDRAGNNFAVYNCEFRLPVLTTFLKRPVQSSFLRNLQVVGFADVGSAWSGFLPTAENTQVHYFYSTAPGQVTPITVQITVPNSTGLALGYGGGLRTTVLGYFLRLDVAWNIEGNPKPIGYFSLGTDF